MKPWQNSPWRVWLVLVLATGLSWALAEQQPAGQPLGAAVVLGLFGLAVLKGALVIDEFMGLRQAPPLWRRVLMGWLLLVCGALAALVLGAG